MFEKALAIDKNDHRVWGNLAAAQSLVPGREAAARETIRKAAELAEEQLKIDPRSAPVLAAAADYRSMTGERGKALAYLASALGVDPENVDIQYRAAQVHEQLGNRKDALVWLGKALAKGYPRASVEASPTFRKLREDPEYQKILSEIPTK